MKPLAQRAAELFSPKPWKHEMDGNKHCKKCKKSLDQICTFKEFNCTFISPIDITDLGKALECFRELTKKGTMRISIMAAVRNKVSPKSICTPKDFVLEEATAEEIWDICVTAKEGDSK